MKSPCFCAARRKAWAACLTSRTNHSGTEQRSQRQAVSCPYCVNGPPRSTSSARISIRTISTWTLIKPFKIPKSTVELALAPVCPGGRAATRGLGVQRAKAPIGKLEIAHLHGGLGNPEWRVQHRGGEAEPSYRESVDATITRVIHFSSVPWLNSPREGT